MFPENYFIYIQLILFYFITPGPPRVVIVSNTINHGLRKSVWTAVGDISANFVQASLVTFVLGSLLIDNPSIFKYFKCLNNLMNLNKFSKKLIFNEKDI